MSAIWVVLIYYLHLVSPLLAVATHLPVTCERMYMYAPLRNPSVACCRTTASHRISGLVFHPSNGSWPLVSSMFCVL